MAAIEPVLIALFIAHLVATLVGAGSIVLAEWRYFRAIVDGRIDAGERAHLVTLFFSLRFALIAVLIINILFGIVFLIVPHPLAPSLVTMYWFEMFIIFTLLIVSWLRFHGRIPFWAGSSFAFVGWWYLVGVDLGLVPTASFTADLLGFFLSVFVVALLFGYVRFLVAHSARA